MTENKDTRKQKYLPRARGRAAGARAASAILKAALLLLPQLASGSEARQLIRALKGNPEVQAVTTDSIRECVFSR